MNFLLPFSVQEQGEQYVTYETICSAKKLLFSYLGKIQLLTAYTAQCAGIRS